MMMIGAAGVVGLIALIAYYVVPNLLPQKLTASGTIEATEVVVSSKTVGRVLAVNYEEGDSVQDGAVLATIDRRDAEANLKNAQARNLQAQSDFQRNARLYQDRMISSQQYDAARANADAAAAALDAARNGLSYTTINAPITGVILVRAIEPGELANIGTPIATMTNLNQLKIMVYISEKDVGKVQLNKPVAITVDAYPGRKFMGKVVYISNKAEFTPKAIETKDERTNLVFGIKVHIPNPEQLLKPGMPADAEFE
jgi:HlyD family secretion protein